VEIKYKPEKDADDLIERLNFSSEGFARQYAQRKNKMPNVISAKYIGAEK